MKSISKSISKGVILAFFIAYLLLAIPADAKTISKFDHGWLVKQTWVDENDQRSMNDENLRPFSM